jgi:hypothetical protein
MVQAASLSGVMRSPLPGRRPAVGPERIVPAAAIAVAVAPRQPQATVTARGSVCGDPAIKGATLTRIVGRLQGCGIDAPVRITSVAGVPLSHASTIDCPTARALKSWVEGAVKPAIGRQGGGVAGLRIAAHYSCRSRNNVAGAKLSEHARGNAIDVSGIVLANGAELSVAGGWRDRRQGPLLRRLHDAACGPFGTVLGPDSDPYHQDHFHLDTVRYRNGTYCR